MFPTLTISSSEFHTNDGRVLNLLKAQGTAPIHYQARRRACGARGWQPARAQLARTPPARAGR